MTPIPTPAHRPTADEILEARRLYALYEPRNDVYLRVLPQVTEGLRLGSDLGDAKAAEGCRDLLLVWNRDFYRFRPAPARTLTIDLTQLIQQNRYNLQTYQRRALYRLSRKHEDRVARLFLTFEESPGATGVAKSLHLLAPTFFPMWDEHIRRGYRMETPPADRGLNGLLYVRFMAKTFDQCQNLPPALATAEDVLKALDEYNYVRFTLDAR